MKPHVVYGDSHGVEVAKWWVRETYRVGGILKEYYNDPSKFGNRKPPIVAELERILGPDGIDQLNADTGFEIPSEVSGPIIEPQVYEDRMARAIRASEGYGQGVPVVFEPSQYTEVIQKPPGQRTTMESVFVDGIRNDAQRTLSKPANAWTPEEKAFLRALGKDNLQRLGINPGLIGNAESLWRP